MSEECDVFFERTGNVFIILVRMFNFNGNPYISIRTIEPIQLCREGISKFNKLHPAGSMTGCSKRHGYLSSHC